MLDFSENHLQDRKYKVKIKNQTSRDWVGIVMILFFRLMCCKVGWASALGDGREVQFLPFLQTFFMKNQIILAQVYRPFLACQWQQSLIKFFMSTALSVGSIFLVSTRWIHAQTLKKFTNLESFSTFLMLLPILDLIFLKDVSTSSMQRVLVLVNSPISGGT